MCQFLDKMDFEFFGLSFGKLPNYVKFFGSNNVEGVAESWVEVEMSWMEVDGARWRWMEVDRAGWRWVHGLVIPEVIPHCLYGLARIFSHISQYKRSLLHHSLDIDHQSSHHIYPIKKAVLKNTLKVYFW